MTARRLMINPSQGLKPSSTNNALIATTGP
jgi:hypothetical protein